MTEPQRPQCGFPHANGQRCTEPAHGMFLVHVSPAADGRAQQPMVLPVCKELYEALSGYAAGEVG